MADPESKLIISCEVRCMDPAAVEAASRRLDRARAEWVAYTCKLSGARESVLLISDDLAARMMTSLPAVDSIIATKILAGLYSAELCECDVATVTGAPEHEVVAQLHSLAELGIVACRGIQGMNYYRLTSGRIRRSIKAAVDTFG